MVQLQAFLHFRITYDLAYTYGKTEGKKFQLAEVKDANYRTEENPDSVAKVDNNHTYTYDTNGNLVYVNTGRIKQDGTLDSTAAERKLRWDEENRLTASDANGNLVYVNTGRIKQDGALDSTAAERKLRWDEENRLTASDDNVWLSPLFGCTQL